MTGDSRTGSCDSGTTSDTAGIETDQGCCRSGSTSGRSASTDANNSGGSSGDAGARDIETDQGCCGSGATSDGGAAQAASEGCGSDPTRASDGLETERRCCGSDPPGSSAGRESDQGCCGSAESSGSSSEARAGQQPRAAGAEDLGNRKTPEERAAIREAAEITVDLLDDMAAAWAPEWTEIDVYDYLRRRMREEGVQPAWGPCPAVHAGPTAEIGHSEPADRLLDAGEVLHVDAGVHHDGFAADLQRLYYYPDEPDDTVPADLQGAFDDVREALTAGLDRLEPGVAGHQVDAAAREALTGRGWSDVDHAFGHQVGRHPHDGGTLLGPLSERYADRSTGTVRAGEVYSVELGVGTTYGYLGLEEMVAVVDDGHEFLVDPQTHVTTIGG